MVTRTGARYRPTSVPFRALGPALLCLFAGLAWSPGQAQQVLVERFSPPPGTSRVPAAPGTFAHHLRQLTVKPTGTPVLLHNGRPKSRQDVHVAVLDIPVGTRDLQQCADAVIRLRAEHLHRQGRNKDIRFHFTNGFLAEWDRWRLGERIAVSGNTVRWVAGGDRNDRPENLRAYLDQVFIYAGTRSLHQELRPADGSTVEAGDVFIQGGSPGHAVLVVDVAQDKDGRAFMMLAQSYMPAQDIHVLKGPVAGAWYEFRAGPVLTTPEWTFQWSDQRKW